MLGLAKNVAERRMRREGRGAWGALLFHGSDNGGDTSSLKADSVRDTPPADTLAHDPYGNGSEINKSTVYMGEGAT